MAQRWYGLRTDRVRFASIAVYGRGSKPHLLTSITQAVIDDRVFPCPLQYPAGASTASQPLGSDLSLPSSSRDSSSCRSWGKLRILPGVNSSGVLGWTPSATFLLDLPRSGQLLLLATDPSDRVSANRKATPRFLHTTPLGSTSRRKWRHTELLSGKKPIWFVVRLRCKSAGHGFTCESGSLRREKAHERLDPRRHSY